MVAGIVNVELVVLRVLLNPTWRFEPHLKPCRYKKLAVVEF